MVGSIPTLEVTGVLRPRASRLLTNGPFVVELATSATLFNPRDVPNLDLFGQYHLYHHIDANAGRVRHSLRLGFFKAVPAAQAVASYASGYFSSPRVTQISLTEEKEAAAHRFGAMKDVGASGRFAAIELTAPRSLPAVPVTLVHADTAAPRRRESRSFWARLFAPLRA